MGVYDPLAKMPSSCAACENWHKLTCDLWHEKYLEERHPDCQLVEVKSPHGRLGDLDALRARMYHEAFDTDTPMQRWESGCWIRYKLFEQTEEAAPTIIPAEEGEV